jgi:arylsulfatase A-like enzyme
MLVPFFIKLPETDTARKARVVSEPVNLLDLAPTILDYAGFDVPASIQGRSLFRENAVGSPPEEIILFGSWVQTDEYLYGAVSGTFKLILNEEEIAAGGAGGDYYDLAADPRETVPLPYDDTAVRLSLSNNLVDWKSENEALRAAQDEGIMPKPTEVDLKGLGYVD